MAYLPKTTQPMHRQLMHIEEDPVKQAARMRADTLRSAIRTIDIQISAETKKYMEAENELRKLDEERLKIQTAIEKLEEFYDPGGTLRNAAVLGIIDDAEIEAATDWAGYLPSSNPLKVVKSFAKPDDDDECPF